MLRSGRNSQFSHGNGSTAGAGVSRPGARDAFPGSAPGVVPREAVAAQVFPFPPGKLGMGAAAGSLRWPRPRAGQKGVLGEGLGGV